jgi:hypothetical protein
MVFLAPIEITILRPGADPAAAQPAGPRLGRFIRIYALPEQLRLEVQEGFQTPWAAPLTPTQAEQLASLLEHLPAASPPQGLSSLDGQHYRLRVLSSATPLVCEWGNEAWRWADPTTRPAWEAIVALTNFVLQLVAKVDQP